MEAKWTVPPMELEAAPFDRYKTAAILRNAERAVINGNIDELGELIEYIEHHIKNHIRPAFEERHAPAIR
jgi:hypothetical protein